jgi:large subunit ribosomal protein L21
MYAVMEVGGKQYRVEPGMRITHTPVSGYKPGDAIAFDRVLLVRNGEGVELGHPYLPGVRIIGEVEEVGRGEKVIVRRFRAKKGYRRKKGYRNLVMRTRILAIEKD